MARSTDLEDMSHFALIALRAKIEELIVTKQAEEKESLRGKLAEMAQSKGFSLEDIMGKARGRGGKGSVPIKYRDPKNSANTWTGRGRMPRWMTEATKARGLRKEYFLI